MNKQQYRQGDVLIERIAALPTQLNDSKHVTDNGRTILAYGEVTGHAHAFQADKCRKLVSEAGEEYFHVTGDRLQIKLPVVRQWKNQVLTNHPEFGPIEFAVSDVEIEDGCVIVDGDYGLLRHDEHNTHAIPAGFYKGASSGNQVRQREYSPAAIRSVAD